MIALEAAQRILVVYNHPYFAKNKDILPKAFCGRQEFSIGVMTEKPVEENEIADVFVESL